MFQPTPKHECGTSRDIAAVEVRMTGHQVDPAVVTAAVGLEPTRAWKKGDVYWSRSGESAKHPWGIWVVERRGTEVEKVALDLLDAVEARSKAIRGAADAAQATVSIGIWWEPEGGQGGFTVSSDVLRRLSDLGDRVDIYFPG
jgi:hypothetical protein